MSDVTTRDLSYGDVLRLPGVTAFMVSSIAARGSVQMFSVLIVLFTLQTHHSSALAGLVVFSSQIPGVVFSPIAGVLLDRWPRVPLMIVDYLIAAVTTGLLSLLSLLGTLPTGLLILIVAVGSVSNPLSRVGSRALLPALVPRAAWDRANAIDTSTSVFASVCAPALAGLVDAAIGPRAALLLPAGGMVIATVLILRLHLAPIVNDDRSSILRAAAVSVRYVWANGVLRMLAVTFSAFNATQGIIIVAIPFVVLHELHGGSTTTGLLIAAMGVGGFIGGVVIGHLGTSGREQHILIVANFAAMAAFIVLVLAREEIVLLLMIAFVGIASGPLTVAMLSLRQRSTPPEWYGRAFAVSVNLNFVGVPIGAQIAGILLADSVNWTFGLAAALTLVAGVWPALLSPGEYRAATLLGTTPK